jgi:hypothetical protein
MKRLFAVVLLTGCAHSGSLRIPGPTRTVGSERVPYADTLAPEDPEAGAPTRRSARMGNKVARAAASFIGDRRIVVDGEKQRYDCSGMVCAAHRKADKPVTGSSRMLFDLAKTEGVFHRRKRPSPGDVAFFDDTYDRNKNGRRDDALSHVAVVETVDADGTITLVHLGGKGVRRIAMNLKHPHDRVDADGKTMNDVIRRGRDGGPVLTGELVRGFGSIWAIQTRRVATR